MSAVQQALAWLADPASWKGPSGIGVRLIEHVQISALATGAAALLALPAGMLIGHRRRAEFIAVSAANIGRALPSFGILAVVFPFTLRYLPGIGYWPTLIALFLLAIPPILTNTYVGVKEVDADFLEAARGMGMAERQVLWRLEVPLAAPLMAAGVRTAALQVVATATLGAVVGWGGLGRYIVDGFSQRNVQLTLGGAILVALLAVITDAAFGLLNRLVDPGRDRAARSPDLRFQEREDLPA